MLKKNKKKENQFVNIFFNVIIPSIILIKFSGEDQLGPISGLIIALAFPISYGIYDFIVRKDLNIISLFGFLSVLLTGIISLVQVDKVWIIIKETSIPLLIIIFMILFQKKGILFFKSTFSEILNSKKIINKISKKEYDKLWEKYYFIMIIPFLISASLNFLLAYIIIQHQPGTSQYTQEIGKMTALSFPIIAIPSMITLIIIFSLMFRELKKKSKLSLEELFNEEYKK